MLYITMMLSGKLVGLMHGLQVEQMKKVDVVKSTFVVIYNH